MEQKIYSLSNEMQRIDVSRNNAKNNLKIGTVLHLNGYSDPDYVIVKNQGISEKFPSYGARYKCINLQDYSTCLKDAYTLKHISEKKNNEIQVYITDKVLNPDEIMDTIKHAEQAEIQKVKEKEVKETQKREEREELEKQYSFLEHSKDSKKSSHALGAANIRKELKRKFPKVKFKVRSNSYSMGCSINVSWEDKSIDREVVEEITNKYQYGSFDGMIDSYNYHEKQFTDLFGGAKFTFANSYKL